MAWKPGRVDKFLVVFSVGTVAADLWRFGEDELAEAVLQFSDEELVASWRTAAQYYDSAFPLPVEGRRVTLGHVTCFACMKQVEGALKPLARQRRRPKETLPGHLRAARAMTQPDTHTLLSRD